MAAAALRCRCGGRAPLAGYRDKRVHSVLGPLSLRRADCRCGRCGRGEVPKDRELGIAGTVFSPGLRRMMGRVGSKEAFQEGAADLREPAGVEVTAKAVGARIELRASSERERALSGACPVLAPRVPLLYIAMDGTGAPVLPSQSLGRAAKDGRGRAKTREAKLGCVFTQTGLDERGLHRRDEGSTSYVGAIETAGRFGGRLYAEALRRGLERAGRVAVLGDGAPWIWNIADEQFPGAIQIVDLYHALHKLHEPAALAFGTGSRQAAGWIQDRKLSLQAGKAEAVAAAIARLRAGGPESQKLIDNAAGYFRTNAGRMRYADFRRQGLFAGSGVVEAGCRVVVGERLKRSGMRWTVRGANSIIALRCCLLSGRREEFREMEAAA